MQYSYMLDKTIKSVMNEIEKSNDGITVSDISKNIGITARAVYKALAILLENGSVTKYSKDRKVYYKISKAIDKNEEINNQHEEPIKEEKPSDNNSSSIQLKFTENISKLLKHFINKYGIKDFNVAVNYLLIRGLLLDIKISEVDGVKANEIIDDLVNLKEKIKKYYYNKLAEDRIRKIKEEKEAKIEALSKFAE